MEHPAQVIARRWSEIAADVLIVFAAYLGALLLRFDGAVPARYWYNAVVIVSSVAVGHVVVNYLSGAYSSDSTVRSYIRWPPHGAVGSHGQPVLGLQPSPLVGRGLRSTRLLTRVHRCSNGKTRVGTWRRRRPGSANDAELDQAAGATRRDARGFPLDEVASWAVRRRRPA